METLEDGFDVRGLAGQVNARHFSAGDLPPRIIKKLNHDRYAWLTTVTPTGMPAPMLVWFQFDGANVNVYSPPGAHRVAHIHQHPGVSFHLESDGFGGGIIILGGTAAVTAHGVDPRENTAYWAKYHIEAEALGLNASIAEHSTRITIRPTTLWTTLPT